MISFFTCRITLTEGELHFENVGSSLYLKRISEENAQDKVCHYDKSRRHMLYHRSPRTRERLPQDMIVLSTPPQLPGGSGGYGLMGSMGYLASNAFMMAMSMVGGDYGEVASYEAAVTASEFMNSGKINPVDITPSLTLLCEEMNRRVFEQGQNLGAYQMGSTVAAIFLYSGQFWVCNIGDSRVYGLRGDSFAQLSVDHTDEELMREQGITNRKPYLTQFLGLDPNETRIVPYIKNYRFDSGDRFLICSDGVTDMIPLHEIEAIIKNERTPKEAVDRLVKLALKNGGKDNITAIICDIVNG